MAESMDLRNYLVIFKRAFKVYDDYYTVIGEAAGMLLMDEAGERISSNQRYRHDINTGRWRRRILSKTLGFY